MRWWMNLPPSRSTPSSHETSNISGCQCEDCARIHVGGCLFNIQVWTLKMFDCIPKTDDVGVLVEFIIEKITGLYRQPQRLTSIRHRVGRDIDTLDRCEVFPCHGKEKAVSASDFK